MKRFLLYIIILLIPIPTLAFKVKRSGAIDLLAVDKRYFYQHEVSLYAMPSYTRLIYSDTANKNSFGDFDMGAGIDYRFFFHQNVGISMGLQWLQYSGNYKFDKFEQIVYGVDNSDPLYPNNPYNFTKRYNVTENADIHYLEVPIKILFITPSWNNVQFRSAIGINVGYNIVSKQKLSGSYEAELNYTNQNIIVDQSESLQLGTFTDINIYSPNTVLKPHVSALAEIGIGIKVSERWQINIDLYGSYSLINTHSYYEDFISMDKNYKGIVTTNLVGDINPLACGARIGVSVYLGKAKEEILPPWKKRALKGMGDNIDLSAQNYKENIIEEEVKEDVEEEVKEEEVIEESVEEIEEIVEEVVEEIIEDTTEEIVIEDITTAEIKETEVEAETKVEAEAVTELIKEELKETKVDATVETNTEVIENKIEETKEIVKEQPIERISQKRALNAPVLFEMNSYVTSYHSQRILQIVAASILDAPPSKIVLIGYTCDIGSNDNNYRLGLKRAQEVQALLKAYGVTNIPIETISKGETNSPLQNDNEENRKKNRRVELIYIY